MFACLAAGRLVQTDIQQVDQTHFVCTIPNPDTINHIVVFLTGAMPFPDGAGGGVHLGLSSLSGVNWHYVGFLSNEKPSAIFKISGMKQATGIASNQVLAALSPPTQTNVVQIGISVEPLTSLSQMTPAVNTEASSTQFTAKILENLYNFASSFAITQAQMTPQPSATFIPSAVFDKWYQNMLRKLQQDPNFWRK